MASDDGIIRIGTEVDVSGIQRGMQEAQAAVKQATANMEQAYELLGKSAALGNAQATATLQAYEQELSTAQSRLQSTSQAATSLAVAERAETATLQGSVSARMAANAELRIFEGNIQGSTRAAGALLASLPGLGSAMQLAFPVFGAVALAEVVVSLGEKMYTAFDMGGERARKTQEEIRGVTQEIERSTTSMQVQIDRLAQEQPSQRLRRWRLQPRFR